MKKKATLIFLLVVLLLMSSCNFHQEKNNKQPPTKFVIGYTNMSDQDVFCTIIKNHFIEELKKNPQIELQAMDAAGDQKKQLAQIDRFIAQRVNAIVVAPVDYEGVVPGIKRANAAGIPVIALGIQSNGGEYVFVGSKSYDAGKLQGQYMKEHLPPNAKVLYLKGTSGLYHSTERLQGFIDFCLAKRPDIQVLASKDAGYDKEKAMEITAEWLEKYPQIDGIIAANDQMALGALQALKKSQRLSGVMISGIDGVEEVCKAIKAGEISQSIEQDGIGQAAKAYEVLETILKGEKPPKEVILPFVPITKDNVDDYIK